MDNLSCPAPEIGHKMTPEFAKIGTYLWFSICAINCFASYTFIRPKHVLGRFKMGKHFKTIKVHRLCAYYHTAIPNREVQGFTGKFL